MCDNPVILNLHLFKRDSYISVICQASDFAVDDRKADAVAHLAAARTQNTGPAFWGTTKDKGGRIVRPLFRYMPLFTGLSSMRSTKCVWMKSEGDGNEKANANQKAYYPDRCYGKFSSHRRLRGSGCVFFRTFFDPDLYSSADDGTVHKCDGQ